METFTLAHLSDPHLPIIRQPNTLQLMNKRITGFLSWQINRRHIHLPAVLAALVSDIKANQPDHIAITGDLINVSLPDEYAQARQWLDKLGAPNQVTLIPGNHDAYLPRRWQAGLGQWAPYMRAYSDKTSAKQAHTAAAPSRHSDFPFVRHVGPLAIIGLSTAIPTIPFSAAGKLGKAQIERLRAVLREAGKEERFRIVLIHHPPFGGGAYRRKGLRDAAAFRAAILDCGAELILHGHTHISALTSLATPHGYAPVISVPSASAVKSGHKDYARWHLYRIARNPAGWTLEVNIRGLSRKESDKEWHLKAEGSMMFHIDLAKAHV